MGTISLDLQPHHLPSPHQPPVEAGGASSHGDPRVVRGVAVPEAPRAPRQARARHQERGDEVVLPLDTALAKNHSLKLTKKNLTIWISHGMTYM